MIIFDRIFAGILMVLLLSSLSADSLFSKQKLCVFVSVVLFNSLKFLIDLRLNVSFNGGLKIFY